MTFRRYALDRIAWAVVVFFLALVVIFLICHVAGPGRLMPGTKPTSSAAVQYTQYAHESFGDYLWRVIGQGSLGRSLYAREYVLPSALESTSVTISLVAWALFIGLLVAIPLGFTWDRRPRWTGKLASPLSYVAICLLPAFAGLYLTEYFVGYRLSLLPIAGYADFFNPPRGEPGGPWQWAYHLIMPGFVLGLPVIAIYTRVVRALARDVRLARARAPADERAAAVRRARTAAAIVLTRGLLRDFGFFIGAALLVESVFNLPGLGRTSVLAINSYDTPVLEGILIFATLVAVSIHLTGNLIGAAVSKEWRSVA